MKLLTAFALTAMLSTNLASAKCCVTPDYPDASEYYAGVGAGVTRSPYGNSNGVGILLGYRASDNFAIEADYAKLGRFSSQAVNYSVDKIEVDVLGRKPLYQYSPVSAYAKVGYAITTTSATALASQKNAGISFGAGIEMALESSIIRVGFERYGMSGLPLIAPPATSNAPSHTLRYAASIVFDL